MSPESLASAGQLLVIMPAVIVGGVSILTFWGSAYSNGCLLKEATDGYSFNSQCFNHPARRFRWH
jgi:hypothetical protein